MMMICVRAAARRTLCDCDIVYILYICNVWQQITREFTMLECVPACNLWRGVACSERATRRLRRLEDERYTVQCMHGYANYAHKRSERCICVQSSVSFCSPIIWDFSATRTPPRVCTLADSCLAVSGWKWNGRMRQMRACLLMMCFGVASSLTLTQCFVTTPAKQMGQQIHSSNAIRW